MAIAAPTTGLIIPYGTQTLRRETLLAVESGQTDGLDLPGAPVAVVDTGAGPLRLSSLVHPFTLPPLAQDLAQALKQVAFLEAHISGLCDLWNKPQRSFVAKYFADVRASVSAHADELAARAGDLRGLVQPLHWCFAAHMILPRAHLPVVTDGAASFAMADFALWTGRRLVACFLATGATPIGARKRAIESIAAAGSEVRHVPVAQFDDPTWSLLETIGSETRDFLEGVERADSPFRGRELENPVRAAR